MLGVLWVAETDMLDHRDSERRRMSALVPVVIALAGVAQVTASTTRLRPRAASWLMASAIGVLFLTILVSSWVLSLGLLSGLPLVHAFLVWVLAPHGHRCAVVTVDRGATALAVGSGPIDRVHPGRLPTTLCSRLDGMTGRVVISHMLSDAACR